MLHSIEQKAGVTRRLALRAPLNNWWGVGDVKWTVLKQDGRAAGYYPDEVHELTTDAQRGAYEWLLSCVRLMLGERTLGHASSSSGSMTSSATRERRSNPSLMHWGLLFPDAEWLDQASIKVHHATNESDTELALPGQMQVDFNKLQESYHFKCRATSKVSMKRPTPVTARKPVG